MLRKNMMSFEEMDKREGLVNTHQENICYRIEEKTEWLKNKEERDPYQVMEYTIHDIMTDCYDAKRIGSYKTEKYYCNDDKKVYEITYDCENYEIIEIIRRKPKPGEAEKKTFLDDIKDFVY